MNIKQQVKEMSEAATKMRDTLISHAICHHLGIELGDFKPEDYPKGEFWLKSFVGKPDEVVFMHKDTELLCLGEPKIVFDGDTAVVSIDHVFADHIPPYKEPS